VRAAGTVLGALGVALALRSALLLGGRGRPERGPRPALVLAGPYRRVRNPLLGGVAVAVLGAAIAARSWSLLAAAALFAVTAHLWVVRVEEPRLRARFGEAYAEYLRCVPRWLPARAERRETRR
jgi:protein-S-isoprenylcysteine O-methyltransferase Ste14